MKTVLAAAAKADLEEIGRYIGRDNPARASTFIEELLDCCEALGDMPRAFPLIPRYETHRIRRRGYGRYLIFYRIEGETVIILRILHGAQDYERILFGDS